MAVLRPFRALRPPAARAAQVSSVPYDVVSTEEARALASANPLSFLHVSRAEIDLPKGTDPYTDAVYTRARDNFKTLIKNCPLEQDEPASIYLYRLIMGEHKQVGVAACCAIDDYDHDVIRKHERTRPDKENDRTRHMLELRAHTGPVFLTYRARSEIDALVAEEIRRPALYDFVADDGIRHTIWRSPAPDGFVSAFREVPYLYIADGHHRAKSASRARAALKEGSTNFSGSSPTVREGLDHRARGPNDECNFFLCVIFPDKQVQILPYNRVVRDLNGLSRQEFLAKVSQSFQVAEDASPSPPARGLWSMYLDGRWYGLALPLNGPKAESVISSLDSSILQERLLSPILGIKDVRTDKRIDFVGGIRGTRELERLVSEGPFAVAFSLYPTTVEDLLRVSDAGEIMPPKSTWFEPKLRDGLLIHTI